MQRGKISIFHHFWRPSWILVEHEKCEYLGNSISSPLILSRRYHGSGLVFFILVKFHYYYLHTFKALNFDVYAIIINPKERGNISPWTEKSHHQRAFTQLEERMLRRIGFIEQVSLKFMRERCQCGGRSYSKWEAVPKL